MKETHQMLSIVIICFPRQLCKGQIANTDV